MNIIKWLLVGAVLLLNAACTYSSLGVSGRVIDKDTKQPIENAVVIATWDGDISQWVQTSTSCYHMDIVLTDKDGKYKTKPWVRRVSPMLSGKQRHIYVYSEGYQVRSGRGSTNFEMEKFKGTKEEYFDWLDRVSGGGISYCEGDEYNRQKRYKLLVRALDEMIENSRGTKSDIDKIENIKLGIELSFVNIEKGLYEDNIGISRNLNKNDNYKHEELMKW